MQDNSQDNYLEFIGFLHSLHHPTFESGKRLFQWPLANMIRFCNYLGNPQNNLRIIHVAGTNGKGSCVTLIATYLKSLGYTVGTYTSPELFEIRERIRLNGEVIPKEFVVDFYNLLLQYTAIGHDSCFDTYSQVLVSLAFFYFNKMNVDYAVIETGIGGALDPTNISTPIISIITSVGLDHTDLFGDNLFDIAKAKSGIIKNRTPVVVGLMKPSLIDYFKKVAEHIEAPFYSAKSMTPHSVLLRSLASCGYQEDNIKTCYSALKVLSDYGLTKQYNHEQFLKAIDTFKTVFDLHCRWDYVSRSPDIILDICDNELGAKRVISSAKALMNKGFYKRLVIIMGLTGPSKISMLDIFPRDAKYYYTQSHGFIDASDVKRIFGVPGDCYLTPTDAIKDYLRTKDRHDLVLILGSIHIVSEAYHFFNNDEFSFD